MGKVGRVGSGNSIDCVGCVYKRWCWIGRGEGGVNLQADLSQESISWLFLPRADMVFYVCMEKLQYFLKGLIKEVVVEI